MRREDKTAEDALERAPQGKPSGLPMLLTQEQQGPLQLHLSGQNVLSLGKRALIVAVIGPTSVQQIVNAENVIDLTLLRNMYGGCVSVKFGCEFLTVWAPTIDTGTQP